jgi:hypothetical protein
LNEPRPGGLGRLEHPETTRAIAAFPILDRLDYRISTRTYRYWWQRGVFLDQGQTGTCVGNAFGHRIADSPVPELGIDEAWARKLYVDASGDTSLQAGTSGLAACRVLAARGTISAYHWIATVEELHNALLELGSVCVGVSWYQSMFTPEARNGNAYLKVDPASGVAGGHEFLVNGIQLKPAAGEPFYRMKNSWGTSWGHGGTARIDCEDLDELLFARGGDAVLVTETGGR